MEVIVLFCEHCGQQLEADSKFCVHCGTVVLPEQSTVPPPTVNTQIKRRIWILALCVGVLCFFAYSLGWKFYAFHTAVQEYRYDEAFQMYNEVKEQPMFIATKWLLDSRMGYYVQKTVDGFAANEISIDTLEEAGDGFRNISKTLISKDVSKQIEQLQQSKAHFSEAESLASEKSYFEALDSFAKVAKSDQANYGIAQDQIKTIKTEMYDAYLGSIDEALNFDNFIYAYSTVRKLMAFYPNDAKLEDIEKSSKAAYIEQVIESAAQESSNNRFDEALALIDQAVQNVGSHVQLDQARTQYEEIKRIANAERQDPIDLVVHSFNTGMDSYYGFEIEVTNTSRFTISSATVLISLKDSMGQVIATQTETLYDIPAFGSDRTNAYILSNLEGKTFEYEVTSFELE
jgi:hypothetical protein